MIDSIIMPQERREKVIDDLISLADALGYKTTPTDQLTLYRINLPHCSVQILAVKDAEPTIRIVENFEQNEPLDELVRTTPLLYSGTTAGLIGVSMAETYRTPEYSPFAALQKILRVRNDPVKNLEPNDLERFDMYLRYAQAELAVEAMIKGKRQNSKGIPYTEIDKSIWGLIYLLNEIPFVTTSDSCEGHLREAEQGAERLPAGHAILPDQGCKFLYGGGIIFRVDETNPDAAKFLDELKQLERKYNFLKLGEHHCGDEKCSIEGSQCFDLGQEDLTQQHTLTDNDPLGVITKKLFQVPIKVGEQRIREYQKVWNELRTIAMKYS